MKFSVKSSVLGIRSAMLVGLLWLLCSCKNTDPQPRSVRIQASTSEFAKTLAEVVRDPERLTPLLKLADQAELELKNGSKDLKTLQAEQQQLLVDYSSTAADFADIGEQMAARRSQMIETILDLRHQMAVLTTDEEWKHLVSRDQNFLSIWEEK